MKIDFLKYYLRSINHNKIHRKRCDPLSKALVHRYYEKMRQVQSILSAISATENWFYNCQPYDKRKG